MLQLRGQIDSAKAHAERLERSVTHHRSQLGTCIAKRLQNWRKSIGCSRMENSRRTRLQLSLLTCLPFHLIASRRERTPWKWRRLFPASSSLPLPSEESVVPTGGHELPDSKRPRRSLPPDCGLQSSQPQLFEHISKCSEDQSAALLEQLRVRQNQLDIERERPERNAALNCDSDPDLTVYGV